MRFHKSVNIFHIVKLLDAQSKFCHNIADEKR